MWQSSVQFTPPLPLHHHFVIFETKFSIEKKRFYRQVVIYQIRAKTCWLMLRKFSGKAFRDRYTARIQLIRREQNLQAFKLAILRDEQSVIVNSKCLAQRRWLKCPRGKFYL